MTVKEACFILCFWKYFDAWQVLRAELVLQDWLR
jgi:hypothetical protein